MPFADPARNYAAQLAWRRAHPKRVKHYNAEAWRKLANAPAAVRRARLKRRRAQAHKRARASLLQSTI